MSLHYVLNARNMLTGSLTTYLQNQHCAPKEIGLDCSMESVQFS